MMVRRLRITSFWFVLDKLHKIGEYFFLQNYRHAYLNASAYVSLIKIRLLNVQKAGCPGLLGYSKIGKRLESDALPSYS